jgi:hypothetical protein
MATLTGVHPGTEMLPLHRQLAWWSLTFPLVMIVALVSHNFFLLNWIHVLAGALWTGADIFMGFIFGPVMRRLDVPHRTAVITYLVPKTLLYFPAVSLTTSTGGWFLAVWLGWTHAGNPEFPWIVSALILVSLMTVQGLGVFLPNSLRIWFELRKPVPNRELIVGLNRINIIVAGTQGVMQVAIIVVMSHFAIG